VLAPYALVIVVASMTGGFIKLEIPYPTLAVCEQVRARLALEEVLPWDGVGPTTYCARKINESAGDWRKRLLVEEKRL
jgi:hypothetical protein